jgi:hypothetical protein
LCPCWKFRDVSLVSERVCHAKSKGVSQWVVDGERSIGGVAEI